jgi:hypothetical protein
MNGLIIIRSWHLTNVPPSARPRNMRVAIRPEKDVMKAENRAIIPKAITRIASHVVPYFLRMRLEGMSAAVYL